LKLFCFPGCFAQAGGAAYGSFWIANRI